MPAVGSSGSELDADTWVADRDRAGLRDDPVARADRAARVGLRAAVGMGEIQARAYGVGVNFPAVSALEPAKSPTFERPAHSRTSVVRSRSPEVPGRVIAKAE